MQKRGLQPPTTFDELIRRTSDPYSKLIQEALDEEYPINVFQRIGGWISGVWNSWVGNQSATEEFYNVEQKERPY